MESADPAILLVEDDLNDQMFITRAFSRNGITNRIMAVADGEEATEYLLGLGRFADREAHPMPRLIITDIKMPRMSGIELLAWIASHRFFRLIPVVVLSSSNDEDEITQAFELGAKGYMLKPVNFGELERLVRTIAEYWRASCLPR